MCGRYYRLSDKQRIADEFHLGRLPEEFLLPPDFNVAPSTFQPVVRQSRDGGERELVMMRWGLVPYFAKTAADFKGFSTINAKAENVEDKAMWRRPFKRRRCLVPADGFYEWQRFDAKTKKPYAFAMLDKHAFAFAGLWDAWQDQATGEWLQSFAIITTRATKLMSGIHDRMPVIVYPSEYGHWLDRAPLKHPGDILRPYDLEPMTADPCNPLVGNPRNNGPELLNSA